MSRETSRLSDLRSGLELMGRVLSHYWRTAAVSIFGALIWMAMIVTIPYLVGRAVDTAVEESDASLLWPILAGLIVAGAIQAIGIGLRRYFGFKLSYRAEADIRNRLFTHIQRQAFSFHDVTSTGELMARASSDLSQVRLILAMLPITVANLAMFLVVAVVLIIIDPVLGLTASLMVPALMFTSARFASRVVGYSFDLQERLSELSHVVEETVTGIEVVKSYGQEAQQQAQLDDKATLIYESAMEMARERAIHRPLFEIIPALGTVAVLVVGGIRVVNDFISIGEFVAFTQYLAVMVLPLMITGWFFANLPRSAAAATRIDRLFRTDPEIEDPHDPVKLAQGPGEIRFQGVSFRYPDGTDVLTDVTVTVPGGTSVGPRGRNRSRQDDDCPPHPALLRRQRGNGHDRWRRRQGDVARAAPERGRSRVPGDVPVLCVDRGQHQGRRPNGIRQAREGRCKAGASP